MAEQDGVRRVERCGKAFRVRTTKNSDFWENVQAGLWETETFAIFRRFIEPHRAYIDIGSRIGPTLLFGCQFAKAAYGIEPDPVAFSELSENLALNAEIAGNAAVFPVCINTSSGHVLFGNCHKAGDSCSSLLFGGAEEASWTVDGVTFSRFVRQAGVQDCGFIKMDIEGGEFTVLPTMLTYLREHRPTLHLSLHAHNLGSPGPARRQIPSLSIAMTRLRAGLLIFRSLWFYKHLYSARRFADGPSRRTVLSRLRYRLDRCTAKPLVALLTCVLGVFGYGVSIVATDAE